MKMYDIKKKHRSSHGSRSQKLWHDSEVRSLLSLSLLFLLSLNKNKNVGHKLVPLTSR